MPYQSIFGLNTAQETDRQTQSNQGYQKQANQKRIQDQARKKKQDDQAQQAAKNNSLFGKIKRFGEDNLVKPTVNTGAKALNTVSAGTAGVVGAATAGVQAVKGNTEAAKRTIAASNQQVDTTLNKGAGSKGGFLTAKQAASRGGGAKSLKENFVKPTAQAATDVVPYVLPAGKVAKGASLLTKVVRGGVDNAAIAGSTTTANNLLQGRHGKEAAKEGFKNTLTAAALGIAAPLAGRGASEASHSAAVEKVKNSHPVEAARTVAGKDKAANALLHQSLLNKVSKAESGPVIAAKVNPDHVNQHIITGEVKRTPIHDISIAADQAGKKIDTAKVKQYEKQIKDGETIEPVVVHKVGDKTLVVDGQHRLAAMQNLGVKEIPTVEKVPGAKPVVTEAVIPTSVPKIKAYGREIELSEKNGYQSVDTPSGKVYSKVQRTGTNVSNTGLTTNWYDSQGNKLTHNQAQAVIKGDLKLNRPTPVVEAPTAPISKLPKEAAPAITETKPVGAVKESSTGSIAPVEAPATRTLKPSETAHMPEIAGYTHSHHLAQDYADMLRGQELQAKGGQLVKNTDGSYKRTTEHSQFYRDVHKETGRPPTKAMYLEEARKQLENGKDGIGASEDYKKLLEREAKPVPRLQVESTVKDVPQGTSKVAQRIAKDLKKTYGELAQYDKVTIADQAKKAESLINDREHLDKVISGEKPLPDGLRATSVITAVRNHPELSKDTGLLVKLAKSPLASESSISAQELRLAAENAKHDPVQAIKSVIKTRTQAVEKRLGKSVTKATNSEIQAIRAAKPKVVKETFESFVDSLKC